MQLMCLCVCVCVHACVCMRVCMHVCMCVHACVNSSYRKWPNATKIFIGNLGVHGVFTIFLFPSKLAHWPISAGFFSNFGGGGGGGRGGRHCYV